MTKPFAALFLFALSGAVFAADHSGHATHGAHGGKSGAPHASASGAPGSAHASDASTAPTGVTIEQCWIRSMPNNLPMAAYFRVNNTSDQALDLTDVSSPAFGHVMLHQTQRTGGMAKMVMAHTVKVPAQGSFVAEPGGYHVMLEQAAAPLVVGQTSALTFTFSDNSRLLADCQIKSPASVRY